MKIHHHPFDTYSLYSTCIFALYIVMSHTVHSLKIVKVNTCYGSYMWHHFIKLLCLLLLFFNNTSQCYTPTLFWYCPFIDYPGSRSMGMNPTTYNFVLFHGNVLIIDNYDTLHLWLPFSVELIKHMSFMASQGTS